MAKHKESLRSRDGHRKRNFFIDCIDDTQNLDGSGVIGEFLSHHVHQ